MIASILPFLHFPRTSPRDRAGFNFAGRLPVQVTHQIKHQQNDQHESQSSASADRPAIGVAAAAAEEDQDNDDE